MILTKLEAQRIEELSTRLRAIFERDGTSRNFMGAHSYILISSCEAMDAEIICEWQEVEDISSWETTCGNLFTINEGTPSDNKMRFCCFCGGLIVERHAQLHPIDTDAERVYNGGN